MKASILIVDDDPTLRRALEDRFRFWGHFVDTAGGGEDGLRQAENQAYDLILLDLSMPGMGGIEVLKTLRERRNSAHVVVLTAFGSIDRAVEAVKAGADDFLTKPADFELLERVVARSLERRRLTRANAALTEARHRTTRLVPGDSPRMKELLDTAERAAKSDATLLITGESGTGKQVLAEHVHANSLRADGPFVYVNCVAISDELVESTLFGHEKGAFTGATGRKPGRLEAAAGGTAFLDEIGDISAKVQAKLLHFLESGEFERVGGNQTLRVDCRLICATNKDLAVEAEEGRFREDLYYRLNVIRLTLPALRERPQDIPILADAFLEGFRHELKRGNVTFAPETLDTLRAFPWPGNVRQLRNAIERMVVLAQADVLTPDLLPPEVLGTSRDRVSGLMEMPYKEALVAFKRLLVERTLARTGGSRTQAAELLELQRTHLSRLIKELDASG